MKKILSFLCVLTMVCTLLVPVQTVEVLAASEMDKWTLVRTAKIEDGVLYVQGNSYALIPSSAYGFAQLPDQYTLSFSMKINGYASMGLQGGVGTNRAGFYISKGSVRAMDTSDSVSIPNDGQWHDYMLEVNHTDAVQMLYVDDELAGTMKIAGTSARNTFEFWSSAEPGSLEVSDFGIVSNSEIPGGNLTVSKEYTKAFRQDWNTIDGWMVEPEPIAIHYPEEGIIRLNAEYENSVYRSIETPLRPPTNYDMEWRCKLINLQYPKQIGTTAFELSTDNRHTWLYVKKGLIYFNNYAMDLNDVFYDEASNSITFDGVDNQWHTWKAEVRDRQVTWYCDGREIISYPMLVSQTNRWHFSIFQQSASHASADAYIDWVEYTPYFEDELKMVAPAECSDFVEGRDVEFIAAPASEDIEKVDYYVNEVYVGSGYKENNYAYTLKNAKIGKYNVTAKVGEIETVPLEYYVKKALDAELSVDKEAIRYGESVKVCAAPKGDSNVVQAEKVEFYSDGKLIATDASAPFETTISNLQVGTATLWAKVYDKNGMNCETEPRFVNVEYVPGMELNIGREYTVDYDYIGGSGSFELCDGYFKLSLTNNGDKITFKTTEGEETYEDLGTGAYKVVATAGYAELYWKNQFVTSFRMPYSPGKKFTSNAGLSDVSIKGSGVKATTYHKDWDGKAEFSESNFMENYYYSIEFDKTDSSPEVFEYYDGVFENVISFREDGIYARRQLTRCAPVTEIKLCDKVEPGYYRLTVSWGIAQLTRNNKPLGNYRANMVTKKRLLKRTMTNPSASTFIALKKTDDIYYHSDDFENNTELPSEDYWTVQPTTFRTLSSDKLVATRTADNDGNHYMNIKGTGTYMLNAIDKNPSFKWKAMVNKREGKVYTVFRRSFADHQNRIGYDFDKGEWFFEIIYSNGGSIEKDFKVDSKPFEAGKWYDFELVCEDFKVKLLCDGNIAFETVIDWDSDVLYYGRVGFGTQNGELNFDNVEYSGINRVTAGLNYTYEYSYPTSAGYSGTFYKDEAGNVYTSNANGSLVTRDNGKTWVEPVSLAAQVAESDRIHGGQLIIMPDGTMVKVEGEVAAKNGGSMTSYTSKDGGKTWNGPYEICRGYGGPSAVGRLNCTMDGRVFMASTKGGETYGDMYLFYSDDGVNWTKSETDFNTANTGIIVNEAIVVDTPRKNEVWFFARSDSGFLDYWISYDNGKTFDLTPHHSGLIQSQVCFRVERDWDNPDTYYAFFHLDTETSNQRYVANPRCRASVAVSYDGMETWEYVTDIMEASDAPRGHSSDSFLRKLDDHIYWRTLTTDDGGAFFGSLDSKKVKTLKRMPDLHKRDFYGTNPIKDIAPDHVVLPKTDGTAFVYGNYCMAKVSGGRCDIDTAEKVFGVEAEGSGSTVTLKLGDGKITFTEGSKSYDLNGKAENADAVVLQGGMFDIKTLCGIFGKTFRESESSYSLMDGVEQVELYQVMLDGLAG